MQELFTSEGVPPKVYQKLLNDAFGTEWIDWLPETLYQEIERTWGAVPDEGVSNKLNALKVFLSTDLFYHDAGVFEHIVHAVNDATVDPDIVSLSAPEEIVYALLMLGPFQDGVFEREITSYIRTCCEAAGLLVYPGPIKFAQPKYTDPQLQEVVANIKPAPCDHCSADMQEQQNKRVYETAMAVVDRAARFDPNLLGDN